MNNFIEIIKILGPALIVLYVVYLMMRSFMGAKLDELKLNIRQKNQEVVTPIRLQAYERIALLLERVSPSNIIPRLNNAEYTAVEFQQILVSEIRQEYNHNLSQQIYMSDEAWAYVSGAIEDLITSINDCGQQVDPGAKNLELVKLIFEKSMEKDAIKNALFYIKNEIRELF